jgi:TetR/AcrR family transcriptional repressor of nem operon
MPLTKQYDRTDVLERATLAFWRRGYEATSVSDLVEQTGLNRGSLYAAFDGKRGLFVECLAHYDSRHRLDFLDDVSKGMGPREAILAVFDAAARPAQESGLPPGCLLVNSALEVSPHDPEVRAIVNRSLSEVEAFFRDNVAAAQAGGTVSRDLDAGRSAKVLLGLFLGLRVIVRSGLEDGAAGAVVDQARAVLG